MERFFGENGLLAQRLAHFEYRAEQLKMAVEVEKALQEGHYLISEAGTGTGKTLAYLIPAILSNKKVIVSTATKNLQEQIYYKDLPLLRTLLPVAFQAAYMKGRNNYVCRHRFERFKVQPTFSSPSEASYFSRISRWVFTTASGDRAELDEIPDDYPLWNAICSDASLCLGHKCQYFKDCFITKLKQTAQKSDIIIVNHHLFFADLMLREAGYGETIPDGEAIIFDEAHQLEEIATHYFGFSISNYRFDELIRDILRELKQTANSPNDFNPLLDKLGKRSTLFFQLFNAPQARYRLRHHHFTQEEVSTALSFLLNSITAIGSKLSNLSHQSETFESLSRRAQDISQQLTFIAEAKDPGHVYWCEVKGRGIFLRASPIEVATILNQSLFERKNTIIFTSATLSTSNNFNYFKERLGLTQENKMAEIILESHFDYSKQVIFYLPRTLPEPDDATFTLKASQEIEKILLVTRGRAFVLFTSYRNMKEIYSFLREKLPFTLLLQGDKPKSVLLKHFREDLHSVLFATASFWEGVDVQGEALSCVIIDKLPFAPPTEPMIEARIEYISSKGDNAFFSYQIPSAIITLKQGLGRLIRNRKDHGVLSILDKRLYTRSYGNLFLSSLPSCPITSTLADVKTIVP